MNIYLDDNLTDRTLTALLIRAGHTVVRPADVVLTGAKDMQHLNHAVRAGLVFLTADDEDFSDLHDLILGSGGSHPGILLVRYDNDPKRDMKAHHIVRAIRNLEQAGFDTTSELVILNHWR
jgi:predicted nuclease of predicted toxin-antitoxin system